MHVRQHVTRVVVHKVMAEYGSYPAKADKQAVAALLGELFNLSPLCFYDPTTQDGFLARGLENARRKLNGNCSIFFEFKCVEFAVSCIV